MKKKITEAFGKKIYLLGKDKDGVNYYLEAPSWDCGWYWGFGYIETYTNNDAPGHSKDIQSHQHFDGMFLSGPQCAYEMFTDFFVETPLDKQEIWELVDYMKTYYNLRSVAELFKHGYSWQTERAKIDTLQNKEQEDLVNKTWLPEVFARIDKLFTAA